MKKKKRLTRDEIEEERHRLFVQPQFDASFDERECLDQEEFNEQEAESTRIPETFRKGDRMKPSDCQRSGGPAEPLPDEQLEELEKYY